MKYQFKTLKNGLRIVLVPMPNTKTATVMVMCGTGSRYEDSNENGLAHFLEHMFFKGTKKRKDARAISEELDGVGASYNAFTSKERTAYYAKVSSQYLDTALDVISDIYLNSTLPAKEIEKERGAIIQEIDMYEDMPMRTVGNVFDSLMFPTDSLGRTILGPKQNIRTFSRADFANYLKKHYAPGNTIVTVTGSFSEKKVLAKITKEFGSIKSAEKIHFSPAVMSQSEPRISIKEKKTDQTQFLMGVPAYPYLHRDEYALELLTAVLGSGMSSRLFMEVREKRGLAYSVSAWTDKYPDVGYFAVQAGVEHAKLPQAIQTVLVELQKSTKTLIPKAELDKAKAHIKGSLTLGLETSDAIAENAATSMINLGKIRTLEEIIRGIERVTAEDCRRVARDIFKTNALNLAIIGPHSDSESLRTLLKI